MDSNMSDENYQIVKSCYLCKSQGLKEIFAVDEVCLTGYFPLIS